MEMAKVLGRKGCEGKKVRSWRGICDMASGQVKYLKTRNVSKGEGLKVLLLARDQTKQVW
jgi:hypothetical protein